MIREEVGFSNVHFQETKTVQKSGLLAFRLLLSDSLKFKGLSMFINNLTSVQQGRFLELAEKLIAVDGFVDEREANMLKTLSAMCNMHADYGDVGRGKDLAAVFEDRKSQVSLLLELIGIAYADESYDEKEKNMIDDVALALDVPDVLMEDLESWVYRQMILTKEAQIFMEE